MMKTAVIFSSIGILLSSLNLLDLETVRINYEKGVDDEKVCSRMIALLEKEKNHSSTYLAYLGGYQSMHAVHAFNPIRKLNTFNQGKKNIEQAILKSPDDVEIRFIRLSVQKKAPSFLGYNTKIKEDTDFILKHKEKIHSEVLKKQIENLLKNE